MWAARRENRSSIIGSECRVLTDCVFRKLLVIGIHLKYVMVFFSFNFCLKLHFLSNTYVRQSSFRTHKIPWMEDQRMVVIWWIHSPCNTIQCEFNIYIYTHTYIEVFLQLYSGDLFSSLLEYRIFQKIRVIVQFHKTDVGAVHLKRPRLRPSSVCCWYLCLYFRLIRV